MARKKQLKNNVMLGGGFFGDVWDNVKRLNTKLREGKYISRGLALASKLGPYSNELMSASAIADQLGYGMKKKKMRKRY